MFNVLSVFDGISCGRVALDRAGIQYDNYFASEIDKYAIQVAQKNYPDTIQLGDILNWRSWNLPKIDLLIGGSPCQGFSNAGKGLNFDDPRSQLFFVYRDILFYLIEKNHKLKFLLENVKMKKEWQDIITDQLGVDPMLIDSALVSAQSRKRLYWMNWQVEQPEDRGLVLADVLEYGEVDRLKSYAIDANYYKGGNPRSYFKDGRRKLVFEHQSQKRAMVFLGGLEKGKRLHDGKSLSRNYREGYRIYSTNGKAAALSATPKGGDGGYTGLYGESTKSYRKLTPLECERLQTLSDNYTAGISNTQRYKTIGNGWTVEVIAHIFRSMNVQHNH